MRRLLLRVAGGWTATVLSVAPAVAQGTVPSFLEAQVRDSVARRWQVEGGDVVLEFGAAPEQGLPQDEVQVELLGSGSGGHWVVRLLTPRGDGGSLRVRAGVETSIPVASRHLSRGDILSRFDMETTSEVRWGEPTAPEAHPQEGWVVQRMLRPGDVLRSPGVQPPLAVHSGRPVDVVWQGSGVGIRTRGRAAGSAPLGGEVFVRTESGDRLRGVVVAPGVVDVTRGGMEG